MFSKNKLLVLIAIPAMSLLAPAAYGGSITLDSSAVPLVPEVRAAGVTGAVAAIAPIVDSGDGPAPLNASKLNGVGSTENGTASIEFDGLPLQITALLGSGSHHSLLAPAERPIINDDQTLRSQFSATVPPVGLESWSVYDGSNVMPNHSTTISGPASAGLGFGMLGGVGLLAVLRKRFNRKPRIA